MVLGGEATVKEKNEREKEKSYGGSPAVAPFALQDALASLALLFYVKQAATEGRKQLDDWTTEDGEEIQDGAENETEVERELRMIAEQEEAELNKARSEQEALREKLKSLENKILVGGENLLEKADIQGQLLMQSAQELQERATEEEQLRQELERREAERIDIEERYSSLQEECAGKGKKLRKITSMLLSARSELADLNQEHQREMEGLLDSVRVLTKELSLQEYIQNSFIPREYQEMIERYSHWNEDIGEWQLKCVAYTGNNMRKQLAVGAAGSCREPAQPDLSNAYLSYSSDRPTKSGCQHSSGGSSRQWPPR